MDTENPSPKKYKFIFDQQSKMDQIYYNQFNRFGYRNDAANYLQGIQDGPRCQHGLNEYCCQSCRGERQNMQSSRGLESYPIPQGALGLTYPDSWGKTGDIPDPKPCEHEWKLDPWFLFWFVPIFNVIAVFLGCPNDGHRPRFWICNHCYLSRFFRPNSKHRIRRAVFWTIKAPFHLARWLLAKPIAWIRHKRKLRAFDRAMQAEDHWRMMGGGE